MIIIKGGKKMYEPNGNEPSPLELLGIFLPIALIVFIIVMILGLFINQSM